MVSNSSLNRGLSFVNLQQIISDSETSKRSDAEGCSIKLYKGRILFTLNCGFKHDILNKSITANCLKVVFSLAALQLMNYLGDLYID